MADEKSRLLRTKQTAEVLGVSVGSVLSLERRKLIPSVRDWAGQRRFEESKVLEFRKRLMAGEFSGPEAA
jgi:hypothetical protein